MGNSECVITEDMFARYVKKQMSGECNMLSIEVEIDCHLTKEEHLEIIRNYSKYKDMYPNAYNICD